MAMNKNLPESAFLEAKGDHDLIFHFNFGYYDSTGALSYGFVNIYYECEDTDDDMTFFVMFYTNKGVFLHAYETFYPSTDYPFNFVVSECLYQCSVHRYFLINSSDDYRMGFNYPIFNNI